MKAISEMANQGETLMSTKDLAQATEGILLRLAIVMYEVRHPGEDGKKGIMALTGLNRHTLDQAVANNGSIGGKSWLKIQTAINYELYEVWLSEQKTKLNGNGRKQR